MAKPKPNKKVKVEVFLSGDKSHLWEKGEEIGLKGDALMLFRHALTEVKFTLEVDKTTGSYEIIEVNE